MLGAHPKAATTIPNKALDYQVPNGHLLPGPARMSKGDASVAANPNHALWVHFHRIH
ncbi:unnamed protein product, partial [marine sediment metagenome]